MSENAPTGGLSLYASPIPLQYDGGPHREAARLGYAKGFAAKFEVYVPWDG